MCGGGGGPSTSTNYTTNVPEWAKPYATRMLGEAENLTYNQPYQAYGGQRQAGLNPLERQGYSGIQQLAPSEQLAQGSRLALNAGMQSGMAGANYANQATDPSAVGAYMSPYMQNVVAQQQQGAIRDYARNIPGMGANAARVGGLGGSRNALVQAEGQRNLQQQLQGIQATGSQQAFQNAQQAQQFGAKLGLEGLGQQLQSASTLGGLGQQQFTQAGQAAQAKTQAGAQLRGMEQQRLDQIYQDYLAQQRYPYTQLGYMSDILHGVPATDASSRIYQAPTSPIGPAAGIVGAYMSGQSGNKNG